jgi:hypothetical protein
MATTRGGTAASVIIATPFRIRCRGYAISPFFNGHRCVRYFYIHHFPKKPTAIFPAKSYILVL